MMKTTPLKKYLSDPPPRFLLLSDLDDTLLGDDDALKRFREFVETECVNRMAIAYASGRFYSSIQEDVQRTDLPEPDFIIGGVGSELRAFKTGEPDLEWRRRMMRDWSANRVRELLKDEPTLQLLTGSTLFNHNDPAIHLCR